MHQDIEIEGLRLSPHQKRLWLWQSRGHVGQARALFRLDGVFDDEAVQKALRHAIARHESLRTTFYRESGMKVPFQVINEESDVLWRRVDLRHLPDEGEREQAAGEAARRTDDRDWEARPLVRATLCRLTDDHARLVLDLPGLCADTWSLSNLAAELSQLLDGVSADWKDERPVQYGQFSEWHYELLDGEEAKQGQAWWARRRPTGDHAVPLPFEQAGRPEGRQAAARPVHRICSSTETERLRGAAAAAQVSLPVLLYACWSALLYRLTGRRDLVCWWRADGRPYEELQGGIGLFERWLPLHLRIEGNMALRDLLSLAAQEQGQAEDWQHYYPAEQDDEDAAAVREGIGFEYGRRAKPSRTAAGVITLAESTFCAEPFKFRLACLEDEADLALTWHIDGERIPSQMVQSLADRYVELLRAIAGRLATAIDDLDIVGTRERTRLTRELNQTARPLGPSFPMHRLIEAQAARRPSSPALVAGERRLSYDDLNRQANQVAHGLRRRGLQPGDRVGLCLDRSADMIVAMLGVLKAGAAYVPIDPAHAAVRLAPQMAQSGARLLVTQSVSEQARPLFDGVILDVGEAVANEPDGNLNLARSPDDLAYVIYTSGSTGQPKGVAVSHRNLANYTLAILRQLDLREPLQFATVSTLSADLGHTAIFPALTSGGCLHVINYETATDGRLFASYLSEHPIDVLKIVPSHFKALVATADGQALWPRKFLLFGGEALSWDLVEQVRRQAACIVINHYGPTETTVGALTTVVSDNEHAPLARTVPIGRPIDNLEAYILDARQEPVPVGAAGELYLGGAGVARGYWEQPDRTAERFLPNPHASQPGARLYRTGDLARRLPDGSIEFLGRVDHQVKIRGFRIELGEIESVLRQHPAVQDAVVTAREDGNAELYLAAYLVARGAEPDRQAIQDFLRSHLPDYMVPTAVSSLPALPLTANGKVDRRALPEPDREGSETIRFVAPGTATEEILAAIWSEVLKREGIGIHDNFFDLGGHSLLATQVMSRLRQAFRVDLPLRTVFEAPNIAQLARVIDAAKGIAGGDQPPPMQPRPRTGSLPLSFAQERLWVLAQLDPEGVAYNIPIALRVTGPLDVAALERSFNEVVRRHESLRTTFQSLNGVPVQVVASSLTLTVTVIDLQHLPVEARDQAAVRLAGVESQRPFDLRYGPLLRVSLIRLQPNEQVLLLTLHHIVSDAWSAHVLVKEVTALYDAFAAGRASSLSDLPLQYGDFSQWQRAWLSGTVLKRELEFWRTSLGGDLPVMELPTDRPRPALQTSRGAMASVTIPAELSVKVSALSRKMGATLYMTLLSAFFILLARMTGQTDLIVGTPIANRTRKETEGLIGFFVNTLAIRTKVFGHSSMADVLANVREACLDAYAHQDMPFEKLVDALQPKRDVSRSPVFQVMFDLQNAPVSELNIQGLEFQPIEIDTTTAKFDLSMTVQDQDGRLLVAMEYNSDLFVASTIERLLDRYQQVLAGMTGDMRIGVGSIHLLSAQERQAVLTVNRTHASSGPSQSLPALIERRAAQTPDAPALVLQDHVVSYRDLNDKSNRLARWLRSRGVESERRVGICLERSFDMVVALLGIMKAGGAYVPIDPTYPAGRQHTLAVDAGVDLVLTQGTATPDPDTFPVPVLSLDRLNAELETLSGENLDRPISADQAAYVIYTSGSTGKPKGVVVSHGALCEHLVAAAAAYTFGPSDRVLQFAAVSFDVASEELWTTLISGAAVVLQPCRLFDSIPAFLDFLDRRHVTVAGLPASYWHQWVDAFEQADCSVPSRVRLLIVGNEPVASSDLNRWRRQVGRNVRWLNAYGPTETIITASLYEPPLSVEEFALHTVPIGRPLPGRSMYVLDRHLEPVPFDVPGEVYIGGETLGRGYLDDPERTAGLFIPDPFGGRPGARLYRTGDRALVRSDGTIEFHGRFDDQVKLRGFRIEPGEIEARLRRHPDVRDGLVVPREDAEGRTRLVAYVVVREDAQFDEPDLRRWLASTLPDYMLPFLILPLTELPRTPGGKVDRGALPAPDWSGVSRQSYVAPATPLQRQLAVMWSEVLAVGRIGLHDNFFDLGGHSLLAVQLIARIQKVVDRPLALMELFQFPTLATLAAHLEGERRDTSPELLVLHEGGAAPPLFCFDPTGTHVQAYRPLALSMADERPVYGLSLSHLFTMRWQDVSIHQLAEQQARLIRERQRQGPYHLLGWSNGGVLALAVARLLEQGGDSVAFLGLLDTQPDQAVSAAGDATPVEELMTYIRRDRRGDFESIPQHEREALQQHLASLADDNRLEYAIQWARERNFLSDEEAEASIGSLKLGYALAREAARFVTVTRFNPIQAPIHVWWTTSTLAKHGKGPVDWSAHTTGLVSVDTVVGDHVDAVYSIHAHQRIGDKLAGIRAPSA